MSTSGPCTSHGQVPVFVFAAAASTHQAHLLCTSTLGALPRLAICGAPWCPINQSELANSVAEGQYCPRCSTHGRELRLQRIHLRREGGARQRDVLRPAGALRTTGSLTGSTVAAQLPAAIQHLPAAAVSFWAALPADFLKVDFFLICDTVVKADKSLLSENLPAAAGSLC